MKTNLYSFFLSYTYKVICFFLDFFCTYITSLNNDDLHLWDFSLGTYLSKLEQIMSIPLNEKSCLVRRKEHIKTLNNFAQSCFHSHTSENDTLPRDLIMNKKVSNKRKLKKSSHDSQRSSQNVNKSSNAKFRYIELDLTLEDCAANLNSHPNYNNIEVTTGNVKILAAQPVKTQLIIGEPLTSTVYTSYDASVSELKKYCLDKGFGISYVDSRKSKKDPNKRIYTLGCELMDMGVPAKLPTINTTCKSTGCLWR